MFVYLNKIFRYNLSSSLHGEENSKNGARLLLRKLKKIIQP
jgi:hypothetical protein